jgi:signal transduction histidine kinase
MKEPRVRTTVGHVNFRDLAPPSTEGPPRALRALGLFAMATVVISTLFTDPKPSLHGDGPLVIVAIILLVSGLVLGARRREWFEYARFIGLSLVGAGTLIFAVVQPDSAGYAGVYFVVAIGGIRLGRDGALVVCGGTVGGIVLIQLLEHENPAVIAGTLFSVLPWFLVMRLVRRLGERNRRAEGLVEELRESRAAATESAAQAERGRVARELHDVLAHSLSALALQLEGTRLLARDRGADPEVIEGLERAHHLAASGLTEARQAISTLRGDDLPALEDLAGTFPNATFTVTGTPRDESSEARLALYRTAQEALTNVRRHSASERVELKLVYEEDGTTLTVQDHGAAAPVIGGTGYGLTGMRERAELLGGRLNAGPTDDGFRVELWLPA